MKYTKLILWLGFVSMLVLLIGISYLSLDPDDSAGSAEYSQPLNFNGPRAYEDVEYQVSLGPRVPGSEAHAETASWIYNELQEAGWTAENWNSVEMGHDINNVVGKWGEGQPWLVIGAHYDSRFIADHDPDIEKRNTPVPGANDGASGVAVLLELARILPSHFEDGSLSTAGRFPQVWLVFFDAEDNGRIQDWDWILGSKAFVKNLDEKPDAVVIVDMIGDASLNIHREKNSDKVLSQEIWSKAKALGYSNYFFDDEKYRILDDHVPFLDAGIRAVDLIDFDYDYYHTTSDTVDKVSATSLRIIGDTLLAWIISE